LAYYREIFKLVIFFGGAHVGNQEVKFLENTKPLIKYAQVVEGCWKKKVQMIGLTKDLDRYFDEFIKRIIK